MAEVYRIGYYLETFVEKAPRQLKLPRFRPKPAVERRQLWRHNLPGQNIGRAAQRPPLSGRCHL